MQFISYVIVETAASLIRWLTAYLYKCTDISG